VTEAINPEVGCHYFPPGPRLLASPPIGRYQIILLGDRSTCVQGWAQGSFVEAEAEVKAERSRQRRGKAEAEAEAESSRARRGRLNSRQGRGEAEWIEIDVFCVVLISCTMHM